MNGFKHEKGQECFIYLYPVGAPKVEISVHKYDAPALEKLEISLMSLFNLNASQQNQIGQDVKP